MRPDVCAALAGTPVVAPACHDTGSAVASVFAGGTTAFLSSGTWSLLGTERPSPIVTPRARELNFTNEGGVGGTTRLLKNIGGLWLLQSCRRTWAAEGHEFGYDELLEGAAAEPHAFRSLFDPDHRGFFHPHDMVAAIAGYCRQTGQPGHRSPAAYARAILESLAFKYRAVLESLEELTGTRFEKIRIVGGGSRNRLLNQFTADATGRTRRRRPGRGHRARQHRDADAGHRRGVVARARPARSSNARSRSIASSRPPPISGILTTQRFLEYVELTCV